MSEKIFKIYKTTCLVNGKVYIGQTMASGSRFKKYLGGGTMLNSAIKKYGRHSFVREILIYCNTQDEADDYEELYIEIYSATIHSIGYNILPGAIKFKNGCSPMRMPSVAKRSASNRVGLIKSKETKEKIAASKRGIPRSDECKRKLSEKNRLYKHTQEAKDKISKTHKGIKKLTLDQINALQAAKKAKGVTLEMRKNMSEAQRGIKNHNFGKPRSEGTKRRISIAISGANSPNYGKKLSAETRLKMSKSRRGDKHPRAKAIEAYNPLNGDILFKYTSIVGARKEHKGDIPGCVRKSKRTAGGYHWRYSK